MNPAYWLARTARIAPDSPAVYSGETLLLTHRALHARAMAISAALASAGADPGDRVALWMANRPEYLEILLGIWAAGCVAVPVNYKLHPREVNDILADAGAMLLFADEPIEARVRIVQVDGEDYAAMLAHQPAAGIVQREVDDLAWLFYTSGTTGKSKGAMLSFDNLSAMAHAYLVDVDPAAREHAMLYAAPLSHGAGLYALAQLLIGGAHVVPQSGGFESAEILKLAAGGALPPLSFFAAPTMVRRLVAEAEVAGASGEGIGLIVYGGGPMYVADIEAAVARLGWRFAQIYGQGETPMTIACLPRTMIADRDAPDWQRRLASVGIAHSCIELRVADAEGNPASTGEGEILVRGPTVMRGYWNNPAATQATLAGGWLHTGDIGRLDADGFLTLTDRAKDVIISGGSNIYPREVEEVLLTYPDIEQVSVVGSPDPEWGEVVVAFLVGRGALDTGAIDRFCLNNLARFKRPKRYVQVADLPKNAYGKVIKTELRDRLQRATSSTDA